MSTSEMEENGEQISSLQSGLVTEFDSEMDYDTKCVLDVRHVRAYVSIMQLVYTHSRNKTMMMSLCIGLMMKNVLDAQSVLTILMQDVTCVKY